MKLWTVYLTRQSGRGRAEYTTVEAETVAEAIKIAEAENPGWVTYSVKQEETTE